MHACCAKQSKTANYEPLKRIVTRDFLFRLLRPTATVRHSYCESESLAEAFIDNGLDFAGIKTTHDLRKKVL